MTRLVKILLFILITFLILIMTSTSIYADKTAVFIDRGTGRKYQIPNIYLDANGNLKITPDLTVNGTSTFVTVDASGNLTVEGSISHDDANNLYGPGAATHINLGVNSTTGADGFTRNYCTIGGGYANVASGDYSTVIGGSDNQATGNRAVVAGGQTNVASGNRATIGGGYNNTVSGAYSTAPNGYVNIVGGDYSWAGGKYMQSSSAADRTFVWGYSDSIVSITQADAFIIYSGDVGIGDTSPDYPLEVLSSTAPQFAISHTDEAYYATFDVSSTGDLTINTSGGDVDFRNENVWANAYYLQDPDTYVTRDASGNMVLTAGGAVKVDVDLQMDGGTYSGTERWDDGSDKIDGRVVQLLHQATSIYDDVQDMVNTVFSAGRISGGEVTDDGDGTCTVVAGTGMIKQTDDNLGITQFIKWSINTTLALTDASMNHVYVLYNGGSPIVGVTTDETDINGHDEFELGHLYKDGTTLYQAAHGVNLEDFLRHVHDRAHDFGHLRGTGIVISDAGSATRNINLTAGYIWAELTLLPIAAQTPATFTTWYHSSGVWASSTGQTVLDNTQYDNGTDLATLTANRYGAHFVYMTEDDSMHVVFGTGDYKLVQAQGATAPLLPNPVKEMGILIGRIIIQKSATAFAEVATAFETTFGFTGVTDHAELAGLQGGTTGEYYHATSSEYTELNAWLDDVTLSNGGSIDVGTGTVTGTTLTDGTFSTTGGVVTTTGSVGRDADNLIDFSTDNQITFKTDGDNYITMDTSGNFGIGTSTFGTSATNTLGVVEGTAPASSPNDMAQLFVEATDADLLLHLDGLDEATSTVDSSVQEHSVTFVDDAKLDTADKQWGTASLELDGDSDYISMAESDSWDICASATDNWTVEHWFKMDAGTSRAFWGQQEDGQNWYQIYITSVDKLNFVLYDTNVKVIECLSSATFTDTASWHHLALIKVAAEYGIYLDGVQKAYTSDSSIKNLTGSFYIGTEGFSPGGGDTDGHIDEFRTMNYNVFGAVPNVGLTDTITIPTSAHTPAFGELKVRDETGNVTILSPHNFTMFQPKEEYGFPWSYYSENDNIGKRINIDMYGAIKAIETLCELYGLPDSKFIYEEDIPIKQELEEGRVLPEWLAMRRERRLEADALIEEMELSPPAGYGDANP